MKDGTYSVTMISREAWGSGEAVLHSNETISGLSTSEMGIMVRDFWTRVSGEDSCSRFKIEVVGD